LLFLDSDSNLQAVFEKSPAGTGPGTTGPPAAEQTAGPPKQRGTVNTGGEGRAQQSQAREHPDR